MDDFLWDFFLSLWWCFSFLFLFFLDVVVESAVSNSFCIFFNSVGDFGDEFCLSIALVLVVCISSMAVPNKLALLTPVVIISFALDLEDFLWEWEDLCLSLATSFSLSLSFFFSFLCWWDDDVFDLFSLSVFSYSWEYFLQDLCCLDCSRSGLKLYY